MTEEARVVVWADVEEVRLLSKEDVARMGPKGWEPEWGQEMVTRLRIREVWKGEDAVNEGARLYVHWSQSSCPPPPYYAEGRAVVAFLTDWSGKWETVALSYGTRYPKGDDAVDAYRKAVALARDAQHIKSQARSVGNRLNLEPMRVDWQVRVSAQPATRWDGMYGLAGRSDVVYRFNDWSRKSPARLTDEQRARFAQGFVENPPLDDALPMMLMVLRGHADKQVDLVAARVLETVFRSHEREEWVALAFDLLRERHGEKVKPRTSLLDEEALSDRDSADETHGASTFASKLGSDMREWARFKKRHWLNPLPVEPPVSGTGGDMPL